MLTFPSLFQFITLPCFALPFPPLLTCHAFFFMSSPPHPSSLFLLALPYHAPFDPPYLTLPSPVLSLFYPTLTSLSQPPWSCWSNNTLKALGELLAKETT